MIFFFKFLPFICNNLCIFSLFIFGLFRFPLQLAVAMHWCHSATSKPNLFIPSQIQNILNLSLTFFQSPQLLYVSTFPLNMCCFSECFKMFSMPDKVHAEYVHTPPCRTLFSGFEVEVEGFFQVMDSW